MLLPPCTASLLIATWLYSWPAHFPETTLSSPSSNFRCEVVSPMRAYLYAQAPPDFSFSDLWQSQPPQLQQNATAPQHRLLNERGQAFSTPDLASASQDADLGELGHLLVPTSQARPNTPGTALHLVSLHQNAQPAETHPLELDHRLNNHEAASSK